MPKVDLAAVPTRKGCGYPPPFDAPCAARTRRRLGEAGGLRSPITSDVTVMPDVVFIKAGTLDDTSWVDPKMHVYCASAQRWTPIPEGSQTFAKMPG